MKYNEKNKPLVCMMTQSTCYKGTKKMEVKGVLWHDTGANNPNLKRYVQPDDKTSNRDELLKLLGKNAYANDWNHIERQAGLNCWVGKLADGTVTTVQTMPWDYRPWGCGSGSKGSCNSGWIQFEICEDGKTDKAYFEAAYKEACEITAYLCKMFNIDPHGKVRVNGVDIPTILCHQDSYKLGFGGNHSDIYDWFPNFGKSMETARDDVAAILAADKIPAQPVTEERTVTGMVSTENDVKAIWDRLYAAIGNAYGVAGVMGNMKAESSLRSDNLQNTYEKSLGLTDVQYTAAVDNGTYTDFIHDKAGYGLVQWTFWSLKDGLLKYAQEKGVSISDWQMQVDYFLKEMKEECTSIWKVLTTAKTVREASDAVLLKFERPADQSEAVQMKRAGFGEEYFAKYSGDAVVVPPMEEKQEPEIAVSAIQAKYINSTGTHYISNSGSDENGAYSGGKAGDQTGKEWQLRAWYNRPWTVVLRYPNQRIALKIAQLGIDAALNDLIGYDQGQRDTYWKQLKAADYEPSRIMVACEEDCSAGVCANIKAAGYLLGIDALKNHTGIYTGNMKAALVKAGFKALTESKYLTSGNYLLPGDILLNESHHTATNITIGAKVKGDWKPGVFADPTQPAPAPSSAATVYYRVRKSWADKASQIGAYTVLQNAKNAVDANPGYVAFDENGNQVYPVAEAAFSSYLVKITITDLNYRKGPSTSYPSYGYIEPGVYTIVDEQDGWGLLKAYAKGRNGWVKLSYTKKL